MKRLFRNNGLSIVTFLLFFVFLVGQSLAGHRHENEDRKEHGRATITFGEYLRSGGFLEATMENWESEFLQMGSFVILTAILYQKGSLESKDPERTEAVDRDPRLFRRPRSPYPVRRGGLLLWLYERSLSLAFGVLFLLSFVLHAVGGARAYSEEQLEHGLEPVDTIAYLGTSRFWFESFQNWQSEYLAVFTMVIFSIFLRQRGSAESKPVDFAHSQTGGE